MTTELTSQLYGIESMLRIHEHGFFSYEIETVTNLLQKHYEQIFSKMYIKMVICGNITRDQAMEFIKVIPTDYVSDLNKIDGVRLEGKLLKN